MSWTVAAAQRQPVTAALGVARVRALAKTKTNHGLNFGAKRAKIFGSLPTRGNAVKSGTVENVVPLEGSQPNVNW